jgi:hypothetical protein
MPSRALVGHIGNGPPGVVGSPNHTAAQTHAAEVATNSGAPRLSGTDRWWSITSRLAYNTENSIAAAAFVSEFMVATLTPITMALTMSPTTTDQMIHFLAASAEACASG